MSTKFINPRNPLRRTAAVQSSGKPASKPVTSKPAQTRVAAPVLNDFRSQNDEQNYDDTGVFNPRRAGSNERSYDSKGEVNAWDRRDAFAQLAHIVDRVSQTSPNGLMSKAASLAEREETKRIVQAALNDPSGDGLRLIAQELSGPIKKRIDHEGFADKFFIKKTLAQGELFRAPKDVGATAMTIGQDGQSTASLLKPSFYQVPEITITSFVEVSLDALYDASYDIFERGCETAKQAMVMEQDKFGMRLIDAASTRVNSSTSFATLSLSVLENLRYEVEQHNLMVDKFLINRQELSDVMTHMSPVADPVTQREWNLAGYIGRWLGAHFVMAAGVTGSAHELIPAGTVYAITAPEYLGYHVERYGMMSEGYNSLPNKQFVKGMGFAMRIGFGIGNQHAVAKAVKV